MDTHGLRPPQSGDWPAWQRATSLCYWVMRTSRSSPFQAQMLQISNSFTWRELRERGLQSASGPDAVPRLSRGAVDAGRQLVFAMLRDASNRDHWRLP